MEQEAQKPGGEHTAEQRVRVTRNEVSDERNRIPTAELGGPGRACCGILFASS